MRVTSIAIHCIIALLLAAFSFSALADRYEDGLVAYAQGDYETAEQHFESAAKRGSAGAKHMLMRLYSEQKVPSSDHERAHKQAVYWTRQAARSGIVPAQYALAEHYNHENASQQDLKQAAHWYQQAVSQGHHGAMEKLGDFYLQGIAVEQDTRRADRLYQVAASEYDVFAQKGDAAAQNALATMYENAKGVPRDIPRAIDWYKKAALQEYALAQYNLGRMFAQGVHVDKNVEEAAYWLRKAAGQGLEQAKLLLTELNQSTDTNVAMK